MTPGFRKDTQDNTNAARLYRLAADQGHADGQNNLGVMHQNGTGVPQDETEATRWGTGSPPTRDTPASNPRLA